MSFIYLSSKNQHLTLNNFDNLDAIVLAPSLYWVQECTIPTKNVRKAKNIASHMMAHKPSDFTEIFLKPIDKTKSIYKVYAYNKSLVDDFLQKMNIINYKLYFADQLKFENVLEIKGVFLHKINDRMLELPLVKDKHKVKHYDETVLLDVKPIAKSAYSEKKSDRLFKIVVSLFAIYVLVDGVYNWQVLQNVDKKITLLNDSSKGMSSYQRDALIEKYKKLEKNFIKIKKELSQTLQSNQKVKKIIYRNGSIKVEKE